MRWPLEKEKPAAKKATRIGPFLGVVMELKLCLKDTVVCRLTRRVWQMAVTRLGMGGGYNNNNNNYYYYYYYKLILAHLIIFSSVPSLLTLRVGVWIGGDDSVIILNALEHIDSHVVPAPHKMAVTVDTQHVGLIAVQ